MTSRREPLRLPNTTNGSPVQNVSTSNTVNAPAQPPSPTRYKLISLLALAATLGLGTAYSVFYNTYLDTSDPILSSLPHPSHHSSYFARKSNIFNQIFVKRAWGWTSAAFFAVWFTSRINQQQSRKLMWRWFVGTLLWGLFTSWFFGPALFERLVVASGGECVIAVPATSPGEGHEGGILDASGLGAPKLINVPMEYCHSRSTITTDTHPALFQNLLQLPPVDYLGRPRIYKGHDVSGHIFLLTFSVLFLVDVFSSHMKHGAGRISRLHAMSLNLLLALTGIWWWMVLMTSIYFHTPLEKISGFGMGLAAFAITQIPLPIREPAKVGIPIPEDKLRPDAMKID